MNLYDQDAEEQLTYHAMETGNAETFEQELTIEEGATLEDLFADLWDTPSRFQCFEHDYITSAFPPAFSIFSCAEAVIFAA